MVVGRLGRLRRRLLIGVGVAMALVAVLAYATGAAAPLERNSVDLRFALRGSQAPGEVAVVQIDDKTFDQLNQRWPFPRSVHARLIDRLRAAGVRTIAYDVQFTEPTEPREDNALISAVARAHGTVLATTEVGDDGSTRVFGGDAVLRQVGARAGNSSLVADPGGVFRRFPFEIDGLESFAVATAEAATGRQIDSAVFGGRSAWIDFRGPPGTIPTFSFSDVLAGRVKPESLRNRIVVVGASAPSLQDVHAVSAGGRDLMSGAEVQANAIATMLDRLPLRDAGVPIDVLLLFGLAMAAPLASLRWGPRGSLLLAVLVGVGFAGACQLAFTRGLVISAVYPLLALVLGALGALAVHYLTGAYERERMRELFSRFVPEQVVGAALDCTDDDLRLGAERRVATVMFCDLRGFTSFAETRPPDVVIDVLNRYLGGMTDAIMEHGGTLVSYMGDGIMAVFGAPLTQRDHADRALAAARLMLDERLPAFNEWLVDEGHAEDGFRMGIGLNSGYVYSGNVGSDRRVEYTAVGDTTNVAARLETMTKGTPHQLFIADSTRRLLRTSHPELAAVDELTVIGRQGTLKVWTLPAAAPLYEASAQAA